MEKKIVFSVILSLLLTVGMAQNAFHYYAADTAYTLLPTDIITMPDSGFAIVGQDFYPYALDAYPSRQFLIRTNQQGDTLWQKSQWHTWGDAHLATASATFIDIFGENAQSKIFCGGYNPPQIGAETQLFDANGIRTLRDDFSFACEQEVRDFSRGPSGNATALVYVPGNIYLGFLRANKIILFGNNGIRSVFDGPFSARHICANALYTILFSRDSMFYYNQTGTQLFAYQHSIPATDIIQDVAVNGVGEIFVSRTYSGATANTISVVKLDAMGAILWDQHIAVGTSTTLRCLSSGQCAVIGNPAQILSWQFMGNGAAYLLDNATGATLWNQTYPTVTLTCGADDNQGGLALAGYTAHDSCVLVREHIFNTSRDAVQLMGASVLWQQTRQVLAVRDLPGISGATTLRISNMMGQIVHQQALSAASCDIFLPGLPVGVYSYSLVAPNGGRKTGKFLATQD